MTRDNNYYLNLILSQYKQPLFLESVNSILKKFYLESEDKQLDPDEFLSNFDLDKAEGFYLDIIGSWFGLKRTYLWETTGLGEYDHTFILYEIDDINIIKSKPSTQFSSFDTKGNVITRGKFIDDWFQNRPVPNVSVNSYSDNYFRILIKLFIAKTVYRDGGFGELENIITSIFPNGEVVVTDGLDGHVNYIISEGFDKVLENLIKSSNYFPKSSGVGVRSFFSIKTKPTNLFLLYEMNDVLNNNVREGTQMVDLDSIWSNGKVDTSLIKGEFLEII